MTLSDATREVQSWFAETRFGDSADKAFQIWSAGPLVGGAEVPALYVTEELAARCWLASMKEWKSFYREPHNGEGLKKSTLVWLTDCSPHIEEFRITITDKRGTNRIASDRYSVMCKFAIEGSCVTEGEHHK